MGRRTFRRKFSRKQRGGEVPMTNDLWGIHLLADIRHDFKKITEGEFYNLGGMNAPRQGLTTLDENTTMSYFFEKEIDPNRKAVMTQPIEFIVPERTAQSDGVVVTPIQGISNFGIVYDAGTFITTSIGAKNVISFGNILDPASTTKDEDSKPIFFQAEGDPSFQFPLSEFGFDPAKADTICIRGVTPQTAMVGLKLDGKEYDAVSLKEELICSASTPKNIRDVTIEKCGIFTSIAKAEAARIEQRTDKPIYWFNIGKTLGDTLLVASTMNKIGDISNPFLQGPGKWVNYLNPSEDAIAPTTFMLKTGDILNHTRAVLKNIPSILERPAKENFVKRYEFVPSVMSQVTAEGQADRYASIKANILSTLQIGYGNLIDGQLAEMITFDGKLKQEYTRTNVDFDVKQTPDLLTRMGQAITEIQNDLRLLLEKLRNILNGIVVDASNYANVLQFARNITPNASMFIMNRRDKTKYPKIMIPVTIASSFEGISVPGLEIPYYNMLTRARYNQDPLTGEYRKIFKVKLNNFLGQGAAQIGGVDEEGMMTSPWEHQDTEGILSGDKPDLGITIFPEFQEILKLKETPETSEFPTIRLFMDYLKDEIGTETLTALYGLKYYDESAGPNLIEDTIVLERILGELERLEALQVYTPPAELKEDKDAIVMFNLFVYDIYIALSSGDEDRKTRLTAIKERIQQSAADIQSDGAAARAIPAPAASESVVGESVSREKRVLESRPVAPALPESSAFYAFQRTSSPEPKYNPRMKRTGLTKSEQQTQPISGEQSEQSSSDSEVELRTGSKKGSENTSAAPSSGDEGRSINPMARVLSQHQEGGLRRTYRKKKNVPPPLGTRKYQELRNRTRNTSRVRQSAIKSNPR